MSSNVGLPTPRGSGTSGYVQRNHAFMKPRSAPYPPPSTLSSDNAAGSGAGFRQRQPDRKILEHDRRREVEVRVMEERERLEERNERLEENEEKGGGNGRGKGKSEKEGDGEGEEGETSEKSKDDDDEKRVLSDEEIDARCETLRAQLLKELEDEENAHPKFRNSRRDVPGSGPGKERRQFKPYQVHELAEAKIEESERLRRALGIQEDRDTGEIRSVGGGFRDRR